MSEMMVMAFMNNFMNVLTHRLTLPPTSLKVLRVSDYHDSKNGSDQSEPPWIGGTIIRCGLLNFTDHPL